MKNIFKICFVAFIAIFSACTSDNIVNPEPEVPVNPIDDRGHEMPAKVEAIFTKVTKNGDTYVKTSEIQKITYTLSAEGVTTDIPEIECEHENYYHLELVYYNASGTRMNHEFVTQEMAPIHQHFFLVDGKGNAQAEDSFTYEYQDTDPETGHLGDVGVSLRKRAWDKNNATALDPIGLKGVFYIKAEESFGLRVQLGHFLGAERGATKLKADGSVRKFNEPASSMSMDLNIVVPIKIEEHHAHSEFSKVEFIFTSGHSHGLSFHGDPKYEDFVSQYGISELKYAKTEQKIVFTLENGQWVKSGDSVIRWRQSGLYGLEVVFYNDEGERVNSEVVEGANNHQIFYNFKNIQGINGNTTIPSETDIAKFYYRDTNPENEYFSSKNPRATLAKNQLGLKGFFAGDISSQSASSTGGVKANYVSFDLRVSYAHFQGDAKKRNGQFREWNELPSIAHLDLTFDIPVRIFTDVLLEDSDWDKAVEDWAKEYNATTEEIEEELDNRGTLKSAVNIESSKVWM